MSKSSATDLNDDSLVLWFDDLGTGNEEHRFLSNFYEGEPLLVPDVTWGTGNDALVEFKTGEHAFAAAKAVKQIEFLEIVDAKTPSDAKSLGRTCELRPEWETVKLDVMAAVVRSKFSPERTEAKMLLATGDKYLCEGTYWRDSVWGVDLKKQGLPGRNWLGTLLMARRAELRAAELFGKSTLVQHFANSTRKHNADFGF